MLIQSPWTLAWGTVAILDVGDLIEGPIDRAGAGLYDTVQPARGANTVRIPRGLVTNTWRFKRVVVFDTATGNIDAELFAIGHELDLNNLSLNAVAAAPNGLLTQLLFNGSAGGQWSLANVSCKWQLRVNNDRLEAQYDLTFGALANIAPGVDPDPTLPVFTSGGGGGGGGGSSEVDLSSEDGKTITTEDGSSTINVNP